MISGRQRAQALGVGGRDLVGGEPGPLEQALQVGELLPTHGTGSAVSSGSNSAPARVPAAEVRVMVRPVQAARRPVHRLQQVRAPDRLADLDRPRRVDDPAQLAALEQPDLEPDAALGAFLAGPRVRDQRSTCR